MDFPRSFRAGRLSEGSFDLLAMKEVIEVHKILPLLGLLSAMLM